MQLAGEGVHGPADADAHQEKKEKRPEHVLDAVERAAAAEKSEGDGNHQREKQHGLKMIQANAHRASTLAAARCFVGVQGGQQVQDTGRGEEARAVIAARAGNVCTVRLDPLRQQIEAARAQVRQVAE